MLYVDGCYSFIGHHVIFWIHSFSAKNIPDYFTCHILSLLYPIAFNRAQLAVVAVCILYRVLCDTGSPFPYSKFAIALLLPAPRIYGFPPLYMQPTGTLFFIFTTNTKPVGTGPHFYIDCKVVRFLYIPSKQEVNQQAVPCFIFTLICKPVSAFYIYSYFL